MCAAAPIRDVQGQLAGVLDLAERRRVRLFLRRDPFGQADERRRMGAEGIGLLRTEHMFLAPDRLPVVREMIRDIPPLAKILSVAEFKFTGRIKVTNRGAARNDVALTLPGALLAEADSGTVEITTTSSGLTALTLGDMAADEERVLRVWLGQAAVDAGARQIECTINGLGERAGNTALEEVVMAMKVRNDIMPYATGIDTTKIMNLSRRVSAVSGFAVQFNKAIVGKNAFLHESGIHQDGVLKNVETFEIMRPEDIGLSQKNLTMGKHSGRAALRAKMGEHAQMAGHLAMQRSGIAQAGPAAVDAGIQHG